VLIMQFIDAYSFDIRSVKKTCVHIVHPDGRLIPFDTYNLFYRDGLGNLVAVEVKTTPTFSINRSTVLFPARGFYSFPLFVPQYAMSADDQRFLMIRASIACVAVSARRRAERE